MDSTDAYANNRHSKYTQQFVTPELMAHYMRSKVLAAYVGRRNESLGSKLGFTARRSASGSSVSGSGPTKGAVTDISQALPREREGTYTW